MIEEEIKSQIRRLDYEIAEKTRIGRTDEKVVISNLKIAKSNYYIALSILESNELKREK